jgi:formate hydrogenlyase subunit 3/multisubunit Na+/H+ antiporter MnhD subunit
MNALVAAVGALLVSGLLSLAAGRRARLAAGLAAAGVVAASMLGIAPAVAVLRGGAAEQVGVAWAVPVGALRLGIDPLTAFFLIPLFALGAVCAIYGSSYLQTVASRRSLGPPSFFFNLTLAAMVMVLVARDAVVFLVAWEVMTISSYLLVSFEHDQAEARRAGWVYLIAGHVGVVCLLALFQLLARGSGEFTFTGFVSLPPARGLALPLFALAVVGFGVKAGVVPLHVWLPEAHAAAPSHVSALMSGVLVKLGLYGLLRVMTFLPPQSWWGPALIVLGLGGGLVGISLAVYQRDLKRALAYSSIENVGVILVGLGTGFWGFSHGHQRVGTLGLLGALLHVWNHAVIKGLLFLSAGSVLHGTGSKDLERLGGLLRRMPWTGSVAVLGAVAIAGLPPLNAFASEWLIYLGLFQGGMGSGSKSSLLLLFVSAGLATMGVLAVLCFVRLVGIALLGQPRSPAAEHAHESGPWMVGPMVALAGAAVAMSLAAPRLVTLLAAPAQQVGGPGADVAIAATHLRPIGSVALALWAGLVVSGAVLWLRIRRPAAAADTWGCGYLSPTTRMQYTGGSFAETLGERFLPGALRVRVSATLPSTLFPPPSTLSSDRSDPLTRAAYEPFFDRWARRFSRLRWLQQGLLHLYLFYILVVVVAALGWASARRWWWGPS